MKSTGNKSERLSQLELLLLSHPEGMRRAEIARRLGVCRATAGRYIDELSARIPLWEQDFRVGIKVTQTRQLSHIGLLNDGSGADRELDLSGIISVGYSVQEHNNLTKSKK